MGKIYEQIDAKLQAWIERQHMFFVASAPLSGDGISTVPQKEAMRFV